MNKIISFIAIATIALFALIACTGGVQSNEGQSPPEAQQTMDQDVHNAEELIIDVCEVYSGIDTINFQIFQDHAGELIKQPKDSCVLGLISKLAKGAQEKKQERYYSALNAICMESDGYVAEAFLDVSTELFRNDFLDLISFITKTDGSVNCLEWSLIDGLSMELGMEEKPEAKKEEIKKYVEERIKEDELSESQENKIRSLIEQLDPNKFN